MTVPEMPREDQVASTSGELHTMKMAGKELDTAIGALNTQLRKLTEVSITALATHPEATHP